MKYFDHVSTPDRFEAAALEVFRRQYKHVSAYRAYCDAMECNPQNTKTVEQIPFIPVEFFKTQRLLADDVEESLVFSSSGTTGQQPSLHYIADVGIYEESFTRTFESIFGPVENLCILALLPAYLERQGSSLIHMVDTLITKSGHPDSGFYLHDHDALARQLYRQEENQQPTLLIGVSFALLDLLEHYSFSLKYTKVMETGGMKGRRKEMIREELHAQLQLGFGLSHIHSEYGMTELLSQAYSEGQGLFTTPPWMKVLIRDVYDPGAYVEVGKSGGINIIDLANIHSCAFISTMDLGRIQQNGQFEVLGRFDNSELRGCNLMVF